MVCSATNSTTSAQSCPSLKLQGGTQNVLGETAKLASGEETPGSTRDHTCLTSGQRAALLGSSLEQGRRQVTKQATGHCPAPCAPAPLSSDPGPAKPVPLLYAGPQIPCPTHPPQTQSAAG